MAVDAAAVEHGEQELRLLLRRGGEEARARRLRQKNALGLAAITTGDRRYRASPWIGVSYRQLGLRLDRDGQRRYFMNMRAVALKELEKRVDEYVHLAEGGETILVTDRDRVLAELIPPQRSVAPLTPEGPLADAVQKGWIRPAASAIGTPPRIPVTSLSDLLQELQRDRSDR